MNKEAWITIVIIIVLVLVGFGIYASVNNNTAPIDNTQETATPSLPTTVTPTDNTTPSTTTGAPSVKSFTVSGKDFSFSPSTLTVNKGDTVKITFVNSNGFHNLKIDEFNASTKTISTGQQETITFVADKTGTFEYYCSVGNHRAMGMVGKLTVI